MVGVEDGVDTSINNSVTITYRNMLIGFAEGSRILIGERTRAGLAAARAQGRVGGRRREKDGKIAQAVGLRRKTTLSLRAIAKKVGLDPGYLSRVLAGKRPTK